MPNCFGGCIACNRGVNSLSSSSYSCGFVCAAIIKSAMSPLLEEYFKRAKRDVEEVMSSAAIAACGSNPPRE